MLIAGSTGLVGSAVLDVIGAYEGEVRAVTLLRRRSDREYAFREEWIGTEEDLLSGLKEQAVDAVICCLGTTMRNVGGDRSKFIHVDRDLVLALGAWAVRTGTPTFCVVSAVGADPRSRVFYSRVKGEMEDGLKALGLHALHIFHPSILTGPRRESRPGERIGILLMKLIAPLLFGRPSRYKLMPHRTLARALVRTALARWDAGTERTYTYEGIKRMACD